jgi:PAS domain S-box-containing protein
MTLESAGELSPIYFQILDTAPDAMLVVGRDGKIAFVNAQTEKLFGWKREDLLGKSLEVLIPDRFHKGHGAHITRYFTSPGVRPMGSGLELFGKRADGSEVAIEVSLSPVHTKDTTLVSAAIRDITERKRLAAAERIASERLLATLEGVSDAIGMYDANEVVVLCNSAFRSYMASFGIDSPVGKHRSEIIAAAEPLIVFANDEEKATFARERQAALKEQIATLDFRLKDGRVYRSRTRQTNDGGSVQIVWDLTLDAQREQELQRARQEADAGSAAKSEFLSSMSHELRTPMNAILGFAQLLQRDRKEPLGTRHQDRVSQILRGGEHLLRLINDILDLSRIEAGGISISTEPVSVKEVLEELRTTLDPMASRNEVTIEMTPLPADLPMVSVDRTRFSQILMNFGSNAIKYNRPRGKLTFAVTSPQDGMIRVTATDTGMGIPAEKQEKLFQPFQRAGQETGPIEGTGIGLVITKRLAELMHGRVGFSSTPGDGSSFWVEIPVHATSMRTPVAAPVREAASTHLGGPGTRSILYVEDNPANVVFMRDLLSEFDNVHLTTAPTAELGIEAARANVPEAIVMDINLPGISGIAAMRALRQFPETKNVPVIALTAAASERDRKLGMEAGFFRYLTKPVKVDEIEAALNEILQKP